MKSGQFTEKDLNVVLTKIKKLKKQQVSMENLQKYGRKE